jgi:hypothetical protein
MKISVDGLDLFTLSETQKKVIKNDINEDIFYEDMCRRLHYILNHKYEQCFQRFKQEWEPKLKASGYKSFPSDNDEFAEVVFQHPDYTNKKQRDLIEKEMREKEKTQ